ncbi:MAG: aminotransferase [Mesorhizobium sp. SCN 65-20]|nr:MAG: aminotransferase [Mesorhizobium sp. SCN 65-20]
MATAETATNPVIDVRTIARTERHPRIFATVEALAPGDAFVVVSDHDPRPLHYQLETSFPGKLTWDYLEQGPEVWRIEIGRKEVTCCGSCGGEGH